MAAHTPDNRQPQYNNQVSPCEKLVNHAVVTISTMCAQIWIISKLHRYNMHP